MSLLKTERLVADVDKGGTVLRLVYFFSCVKKFRVVIFLKTQ